MSVTDKSRLHIHEYCFELFVLEGEVQLKFPCTFFLTWKTGKHSTQDIESVAPNGNLIPFNSHLELTSELAYNEQTESYLEKRSFVSVYLNSLCRNNTPKLVGVVTLDLSQCLNKNTYDKPRQHRIERCPDKQSHLTFHVKSRFVRELGRDEIRDMSFSFQNEIDQQIARRESLAVEEHRLSFNTLDRSQGERRSLLTTDVLAIPPLRRSDNTENEQAAVLQEKKGRTSRHHRDMAGSTVVRSQRADFDGKHAGIRASVKKTVAPKEGPRGSVHGSNCTPSQNDVVSSSNQPGQKTERQKWIAQMQSTIAHRRNQLKDSVLKDYMSRHEQECSELRISLESEKAFRLKLEIELESVRVDCLNLKAANKDLEKKLLERPPEQEPNVVRKLRDSLNDSERKMLQANETIDAVNGELKRLRQESQQLRRRMEEMRSTNDVESHEKDQLTRELRRVREQLLTVGQEKTKALNELEQRSTIPIHSNVSSAELNSLKEDLEIANNRLADEKRAVNSLREQLKSIIANEEMLRLKCITYEAKQSELKLQLDVAESALNASISASKLREEELCQIIDKLNHEMALLTKNLEVDNGHQSTGKLYAKIELYEKNNTFLQQALLKSEKHCAQYKHTSEELRSRILDMLNEAQQKQLAYDRSIEALNQQLNAYRDQLKEFEAQQSPRTLQQQQVRSIEANLSPNQQIVVTEGAVNTSQCLYNSDYVVLSPREANQQPAKPFRLEEAINTNTCAVQTQHIILEQRSAQTENVIRQDLSVQTEFPVLQQSILKVLAEEFVQTDQPEAFEVLEPQVDQLTVPIDTPQHRSIIDQFEASPSVATEEPPTERVMISLEEYNFRAAEYEQRIADLERYSEKIGGLNEENVELQLRVDEYQQEAWNLRASLEEEMQGAVGLRSTIEQLKQTIQQMQQEQQETKQQGSEGTRGYFETEKQYGELQQQYSQLITKFETSQLLVTQLQEEVAEAEGTTNELFERLREKDERETEQQEIIHSLEQKLFVKRYRSESIQLSPDKNRPSPLKTSIVLQKEDFKSGVAQEIMVDKLDEAPLTPTRIIDRPNQYEGHPEIKMNPLLSQIHILAKRLSTTSKEREDVAIERNDRQLIIKYLEDQLAKLRGRIQQMQEELFKARAEIIAAEKRNHEMHDRITNMDFRAISTALSTQIIKARIEGFTPPIKLRRANTLMGKPSQKPPADNSDTISLKHGDSIKEHPMEESRSHSRRQQSHMWDQVVEKPQNQHQQDLLVKEQAPKLADLSAKNAECEQLHEQLARAIADANLKDIRIEELTEKIQSLEASARDYEKLQGRTDRQSLSPILRIESPRQSELPDQTDKLYAELNSLRKEREVYIRIIENAKQKEMRAEADQAELDQLRSENDELRRECNHFERLNAEMRTELDLQREELLGSRITLSPIGKPIVDFQQGGQEWEAQTGGLHQLLVTLTTRNRLLMERIRALSNQRMMLQTGLKEAVEETQRLTARLLSTAVSLEQKKQAMRQVRPMVAQIQSLLKIIGSVDTALLTDESEERSMDSIARDSEF